MWADYNSIVSQHIDPIIGRIALGKLTPSDVQGLLNAKLADGLSPSRVHAIHGVLGGALHQAEKWELVSRNVARLVDGPRMRRQPIDTLSIDQARTFLDAIEGHPLYALCVLALATGGRQGELLALEWPSIDLEARTLTIKQALQRFGGQLHLVEPKTDRSVRTVTLPGMAVEVLRQHSTRQAEARLRAGSVWTESSYVFTSPLGKPLEGTNVTHQFQALLERADLPRVRFHSLRHLFATTMLAAGVNHRTLMELMGHSEVGTTLNIYADVVEPLKVEASERMNLALTGS